MVSDARSPGDCTISVMIKPTIFHGTGPSKKELNKMARKAGRQGNKDGVESANEGAAASGGPAFKPSGISGGID